jgi:murein DD-endopeptidase MepM/ murein hydrolase activator NlpD
MHPTRYDLPLTGLDWLQWYAPHKVYHPGLDYNFGRGMDDLGAPIYAAKNGYIQYSHENVGTSGGFGKFVIILHADGTYTRYAHLQTIEFKSDPYVEEGAKIGTMGNTGTTYSHLHFEVFNEKCAKIQRNHWKPWRFYPSNKSKAWVQEHYLNPWEWVKTEKELTDLEKGYQWLIENKFVLTSKAKDPVTVEMLGLILKRISDSKK